MSPTNSTAVDARASAAVAAKISTVVAQPGMTVRIPATTLGWLADELRFAGDLTPERARVAAEFALTMNQIPDSGPTWRWDGVRLLWDTYRDILDADLASSARTPGQDAELAAAQAVIHVGGDPLGDSTPQYQAYQSHRALWLAASMALAQGRGSDQEPALAAQLDAAAQSWIIEGFKDTIETAIGRITALRSKSPAVTWQGYRSVFDPGPGSTDWATAIDGTPYAPTGFVPASILDAPWTKLSLSAAELGDTSAEDAIVAVSFEYAVARVSRPWLDEEVFASTVWRNPPRGALSDGGAPPAGACPSYVQQVVFARSIEVTRKVPAAPTTPAKGIGTLDPGAIIGMREIGVQLSKGARLHDVITRSIVRGPVSPVPPTARVQLAEPVIGRSRVGRIAVETGQIDTGRIASGVGRIDRGPIDLGPINPGPMRGGVGQFVVNERLVSVLRSKDFTVLPLQVTPDVPDAPAGPATATTTSPADFVAVAALLCRDLPVCPDPDPSLTWG